MVLFVGDRPSKRTDPDVPFKGAACEKRLNEWIDYLIDIEDIYLIINSDDSFLLSQHLMMASFYETPVVALGNNAAKAITRNRLHTVKYFKLPHPSARNRQINNPKFIKQKLKECKEWLDNENRC